MWVNKAVVDWFQISKDSVDALREENAGLKAENSAVRSELSAVKANFDWLRVRVNALEVERAALLEKVSGVRVPVPEVVRANPIRPETLASMFEDMTEDEAKKFGLPVYGN